MSTPSPLLRTLDPPAGGWERLIRRRDGESWTLPVAALACAAMLVVFAFPWPHRVHLELGLSGARLLGERSDGATVRMLDGRQIVALPSADPSVKLYWIDGRKAQETK